MVQREPEHARFVKTHCVTRGYPKQLNDAELAEAIAALRADMLLRQPSDPLSLQAAENLKTLTAEVDYRARERTVSDQLTAIGAAKDDEAEHRRATDKLIAYARGQLDEYPAKVDLFLRQAAPDIQEKTRILGAVTAAAARMEFLLGSIYHRAPTGR